MDTRDLLPHSLGMTNIAGKTIVLTGASSGIGASGALQLAAAGANMVLLARREDALAEVAEQIRAAGGRASTLSVDLSDADAVRDAAERLLAEHTHIDVLINNAGKSIRRPIVDAIERPHDFSRLMDINYFGPVHLTLALLPHFIAHKRGHLVQVSSVSAQMPTPRFAAYVASKNALEGFTRSLAAELRDTLPTTIINYPLVRTPMTAPTALYKKLPMMDVDEAGAWMVQAVRNRPPRITALPGRAWAASTAVAPGITAKATGWFFDRMARRLAQQSEK